MESSRGVGYPCGMNISANATRRREATLRNPRITRRIALQGALGVAGLTLVGCSAPFSGDTPDENPFDLVAWPKEDKWPEAFYQASPRAQEAYRYATTHKDELIWMPCFCGCVDTGHTSNYSCYVKEERDDGSVLLDAMSFT